MRRSLYHYLRAALGIPEMELRVAELEIEVEAALARQRSRSMLRGRQ